MDIAILECKNHIDQLVTCIGFLWKEEKANRFNFVNKFEIRLIYKQRSQEHMKLAWDLRAFIMLKNTKKILENPKNLIIFEVESTSLSSCIESVCKMFDVASTKWQYKLETMTFHLLSILDGQIYLAWGEK